jgi:hypothetical protein
VAVVRIAGSEVALTGADCLQIVKVSIGETVIEKCVDKGTIKKNVWIMET